MTVNHYFQSGNTSGISAEQRLVEDLIIESIKIYGHQTFYLPRKSVNPDTILGEDILNEYSSAYAIEMYLNNIQGWAGSGELFSKFGLQINDQATFVVARRRWEQALKKQGADEPLPPRPFEGDLVYFPKTKSLFEITYVEHLNPFYQLGKFYVYSLQCSLYNYSAERLNTGIPDIDQIQGDYSVDTLQTIPGEAKFNDGPVFQTEAADLIDFSVNNPFGDV
jgi:hypothetical protein